MCPQQPPLHKTSPNVTPTCLPLSTIIKVIYTIPSGRVTSSVSLSKQLRYVFCALRELSESESECFLQSLRK